MRIPLSLSFYYYSGTWRLHEGCLNEHTYNDHTSERIKESSVQDWDGQPLLYASQKGLEVPPHTACELLRPAQTCKGSSNMI